MNHDRLFRIFTPHHGLILTSSIILRQLRQFTNTPPHLNRTQIASDLNLNIGLGIRCQNTCIIGAFASLV